MKKKSGYILVLLLSMFLCHAQNFDVDLLKKINGSRNTSLDQSFKTITNSAVPIGIATPIIMYSVSLIQKDSVMKQKALFVGETFLASAFITLVSKEMIKRERPYNSYPEIHPLVVENSYAMPSGHTSIAFATATSLSMAYPKWYVIAPSFAWASAVGYSRMHLGVHYPSDVFIGALVGSGSAYLTHKANQWINKQSNKKKR